MTILLLQATLLLSCLIGAYAQGVVFQKTVNIDDKWQANVVILEGQEPADVIFNTLRPYGVDFTARRNVLNEVKKAGVPYSKEFAEIFSKSIVLEDSSFSGTFIFHDDGQEPIDELYDFATKNDIESHFRGLTNALLPQLCELVPCSRKRPRIWRNEITSDDGQNLGVLEVLDGDEPIDVIDTFVQRITADIGDKYVFRQNMLSVVCKSTTCSRTTPVIFKKEIKDQNGLSNGSVEIFENDEVIDAVVRFIRKSKLSLDEIALKNYMLQQACVFSRIKCTRNIGVVYTQKINIEGASSPANTLTIYENEEPADKVYRWLQDNKVSTGYLSNIMDSVCDSDLVICNRREPVYFSIPISGPDGAYVNTLELIVGHEPIDDMYAFFASNRLFKKGLDFGGVVSQICTRPNVDCRRQKAVKHYDHNFTMGSIDMGQVVIWQDEEVIDVLYNLRKSYNLTLEDQTMKFNEICKKPDVVCERTRAVVFHKTDITKLDYEKFGNETCKRHVMGVKFVSTMNHLPFGSKVADFLKEDTPKEVLEHPLFCVAALIVLLFILDLVTRTPRLKTKVNKPQKLVLGVWLVFVVSILQAVLVEPNTAVDKAMHVYEGRLPDLIILEDEEPADALIKWGGSIPAAKSPETDLHPVVREPMYWEILNELCNKTSLICTRNRAWEFLNLGAMTYFGNEFSIEYYNPEVDPIERMECHPIMNGTATSCMEKAASQFCGRFLPQPDNCVKDMTMHIASQVKATDEKRLDAKCSYERLQLEMDAPGRELYPKVATVARERKVNVSPFRRVDNGTSLISWSKEYVEAGVVIDTFQKIKDPESRIWNDKPCTPYFNGAMCAKTDKDGNMIIEVGN